MNNYFLNIKKFFPTNKFIDIDIKSKYFNNIASEISYKIYQDNPSIHILINNLLIDKEISYPLTKLDAHNSYTFIHSLDTAIISAMLCKSLGFNEYETYIILKGAILHDIGKIYIPNSILNKKESLDFKEYEIVKYHPALGSKMLHRLNIDTSVIQDIVLYHHESLDGTGYPLGKLSDSLSSHVKIVTISDVFSAMTSNRSYRNKLSLVKALDYLSQNSDIKFDSLMVRTLIKILS